MKISHIVTNGCSFTFGDGLSDRATQSWPSALGKKLGVDVVNLARSGSGNDRICRRTYEYFYEDLKNDNHPLYVIMFSAINRQDRWLEDEQRFQIISPADTHDPVSRDFVYNSNKVVFYRQYMLYRLSLKNLFEAYNIPYIFYQSIDILENREQKDKMRKDITNILPNTYDILDKDVHWAGDASVITAEYPRTNCMHWGPEGNEAVAEHAYKKLNELYSNIEIEPNNQYVTDLDHIKQAEPYYSYLYNMSINDLHSR
jgi:hypothetical protein